MKQGRHAWDSTTYIQLTPKTYYADDIVQVVTNLRQLQTNINIWKVSLEEKEIKINKRKSYILEK